MLNIYSYTCWPTVCLGKMSVQILCPFFNQIAFQLSCISSLYIFNINPVSEVSFSNTFSFSGCFFVLMMVSSDVQNFQADVVSLIFAFVFLVLGVRFTKTSLRPMSGSLVPVFALMDFAVSGLALVFNPF